METTLKKLKLEAQQHLAKMNEHSEMCKKLEAELERHYQQSRVLMGQFQGLNQAIKIIETPTETKNDK